MDIAQGVPRAAEVVAVDHAVAAGTCAEGRVKSVVTTHFHELTLANAPAAEEHRVDRSEIALVEEGVNLLGDVDRLAPSVSAVATMEHRHAVGVAALGRAVSVNGVARDANHHGLVAVAVTYDGGIAISAGFAAVHAVALGQNEFAAPSGAVIVREAVAQIHFAETDVPAAGPIVAHGDERSAAIHRNGGNAIGRFPGKCLEEGRSTASSAVGRSNWASVVVCAPTVSVPASKRERKGSRISRLIWSENTKFFPIWRELERIGEVVGLK